MLSDTLLIIQHGSIRIEHRLPFEISLRVGPQVILSVQLAVQPLLFGSRSLGVLQELTNFPIRIPVSTHCLAPLWLIWPLRFPVLSLNFVQSCIVAQSPPLAPVAMRLAGSMGEATAHHVPLIAATLVTHTQTQVGAAAAAIDMTPAAVAAARALTLTDYCEPDTKH